VILRSRCRRRRHHHHHHHHYHHYQHVRARTDKTTAVRNTVPFSFLASVYAGGPGIVADVDDGEVRGKKRGNLLIRSFSFSLSLSLSFSLSLSLSFSLSLSLPLSLSLSLSFSLFLSLSLSLFLSFCPL